MKCAWLLICLQCGAGIIDASWGPCSFRVNVGGQVESRAAALSLPHSKRRWVFTDISLLPHICNGALQFHSGCPGLLCWAPPEESTITALFTLKCEGLLYLGKWEKVAVQGLWRKMNFSLYFFLSPPPLGISFWLFLAPRCLNTFILRDCCIKRQ